MDKLNSICRSSSAQLRPYGPVYSVQPTAYALKRNGKHVEGSYEDHLEKAARISNEMNAFNQLLDGLDSDALQILHLAKTVECCFVNIFK
ncbi:hypothetical protein ANCDUO_14289 [Ancylostoma duodenale]|uniref:Uncharacterized protein n=1 Tax=Ancylostoma duodenale TaxID=51022 RepID=A0A0C2G9J8_9BILA|nr:hypothetical protein ANCDUO_14289 [Ancylostoma duodenale]